MHRVDDASLTDPHELLEVYDPDGRPTGVAKPRGAGHKIHLIGAYRATRRCHPERSEGSVFFRVSGLPHEWWALRAAA